jgi:hypothetical protein
MTDAPRRLARAIAAIGLTLGVTIGVVAIPQPAQAAGAAVVPMSDALAHCINVYTGQPDGTPVTEDRMAALSYLECIGYYGTGVDDLSGLEYATSIVSLSIDGVGSNGDLTPLRTLTTLQSLSITNFSARSLASVSRLTNLTYLQSYSNPLVDAHEVAGLTNLRVLLLGSSQLVSTPDLSRLTQLTTVNLRDNQLTVTPDLRNKPGLTDVSLGNNLLTTAPDFTGSTAVTFLSLDRNRIIDLSSLSGLSSLRQLWAEYNSLIDLGPLSLLGSLIDLRVRFQNVTFPTITYGSPNPVPVMLDPRGGAIALTVPESSALSGGVGSGNLYWNGVGTGTATFSQAVPYGTGSATTTFSGTIRQTVRLGTLTTATPTISGSAVVGQKLTAHTGTWKPEPVTHRYQWNRNGAAISGATASTYTPTSSDRGRSITVSVWGGKYGYSAATKTSAATAPVLGALITKAPTVSGTAKVGATLTATPGSWSPTPVSFSYQWKRGGSTIAGATAATYKLTNDDAGRTITVTVVGTKSGYQSASRTSAATATVTGGTLTASTPTIAGTARVGETLTGSAGAWGPGTVKLTYYWKRNGTVIASGEGLSAYTLVAADRGAAMSLTVRGDKTGFTTKYTTSASTPAVLGVLTTVAPKITGTTTVGSTLTVTNGVWQPEPVTMSYQWKRNGQSISGATAKTYVPVTADAGTTLTVVVTGSKAGYQSATLTTPASATITGGTLTAPTPTVSGTAKVGSTLTAVPGTWGPSPVTLTYQWLRGTTVIAGATASTYKPVTADKGVKLAVRVTGTKTGFTTSSKVSALTATVG